jgi:hypothetical protein
MGFVARKSLSVGMVSMSGIGISSEGVTAGSGSTGGSGTFGAFFSTGAGATTSGLGGVHAPKAKATPSKAKIDRLRRNMMNFPCRFSTAALCRKKAIPPPDARPNRDPWVLVSKGNVDVRFIVRSSSLSQSAPHPLPPSSRASSHRGPRRIGNHRFSLQGERFFLIPAFRAIRPCQRVTAGSPRFPPG